MPMGSRHLSGQWKFAAISPAVISQPCLIFHDIMDALCDVNEYRYFGGTHEGGFHYTPILNGETKFQVAPYGVVTSRIYD